MLNLAILALIGLFFWMVIARLYPVEGVGFASTVEEDSLAYRSCRFILYFSPFPSNSRPVRF